MWHVTCISTFIFFYKQAVYKQVALRWQICKQLSGLNPFSLINNKNYRIKKSGVFVLCEIAVKRTIYHNSAALKALLGKL